MMKHQQSKLEWDQDLLWVAGGRDYDNGSRLREELNSYIDAEMTLITGAATGADLLAQQLWKDQQLPYIGVPARWAEHGRRAGPIRNRLIAVDYEPTVLVLFPGGRGTADTKQVAREYGIPYSEVNE